MKRAPRKFLEEAEEPARLIPPRPPPAFAAGPRSRPFGQFEAPLISLDAFLDDLRPIIPLGIELCLCDAEWVSLEAEFIGLTHLRPPVSVMHSVAAIARTSSKLGLSNSPLACAVWTASNAISMAAL